VLQNGLKPFFSKIMENKNDQSLQQNMVIKRVKIRHSQNSPYTCPFWDYDLKSQSWFKMNSFSVIGESSN
jgi:hypothetical protein